MRTKIAFSFSILLLVVSMSTFARNPSYGSLNWGVEDGYCKMHYCGFGYPSPDADMISILLGRVSAINNLVSGTDIGKVEIGDTINICNIYDQGCVTYTIVGEYEFEASYRLFQPETYFNAAPSYCSLAGCVFLGSQIDGLDCNAYQVTCPVTP